MKLPLIKDILNSEHPQNNITLQGWVKTVRHSKGFSFVEINDGSCRQNIQVVADQIIPSYSEVLKLTTGSSVRIQGDLVESVGAKQKYEIKAKDVSIYGECPAETYPIQKKNTTDEFLRTVAHLRPRTNKYSAMLRVRSELSYAIHTFFKERDFYYVHTPIITGADGEGAGQMFQVTTMNLKNIPQSQGEVDFSKDFFGRRTSLTVTGQLQGELAALALGRVYTFGPTFRAEPSTTPRHASEFWMIEPEMAFYEIDDLMNLEEEFIKYIVKHIREKCSQDLELFQKFVDTSLYQTLDQIIHEPFLRLSYTEAIGILEKHNDQFTEKVHWGVDLGTEHERFIVEKHFKKPVILYDYPKDIKAFYMKQNDDGKTVRGTDVLVPRIGEIIGGSQREESYEKLLKRLHELQMKESEYWWYLDSRRFGSVPHSGFGLGFERAMMLVTGITNIRDVTLIPRVPNFAEF